MNMDPRKYDTFTFLCLLLHFICSYRVMWVQKDLIEPAVHGTNNILTSVAKNKHTVKRVVLTSSFAGMCLASISLLSFEAFCQNLNSSGMEAHCHNC